MAKPTREELQAQLDALDAEDSGDDDQVTISKGDASFTGPLRKVREVAEAWGLKLKADPPAEPKGDGGSKGKDDGVRAFGRRVS